MARTTATNRLRVRTRRPRERDVGSECMALAPALLDVVALGEPLPEHHLPAGTQGTIVETFTKPDRAYLVEFTNDQGETVAEVVLRPHQFSVVWRAWLARERRSK